MWASSALKPQTHGAEVKQTGEDETGNNMPELTAEHDKPEMVETTKPSTFRTQVLTPQRIVYEHDKECDRCMETLVMRRRHANGTYEFTNIVN